MTAEIVPDDKDWTWVLERPCPECGFDASTVDARSAAPMIRTTATAWLGLGDSSSAMLRQRPAPNRWSTLEYAAHVRDVHRLYLYRLELMLENDDPLFPNWDQDATAVADRYGDQDPAVVWPELGETAEALAAAFDRVSADAWNRVGRRSDGAVFTIETFALYLVHDLTHHVWDVTASH